jgi:hypothetical protein
MPNGIMKKEIAEDINAIDKLEAPEDACANVINVFKTALKRALRIGEEAYNASKQIKWMLAFLIVITVKNDVWNLITWLAKVVK